MKPYSLALIFLAILVMVGCGKCPTESASMTISFSDATTVDYRELPDIPGMFKDNVYCSERALMGATKTTYLRCLPRLHTYIPKELQ